MSGLLAAVEIAATNTLTQIYAVPTGKLVSFTINVTNRNGTGNAKIRLALSDLNTPTTAQYIEFDQAVYPNEKYERPGIVLSAGQMLFCISDQPNVAVQVWGIEEDAS